MGQATCFPKRCQMYFLNGRPDSTVPADFHFADRPNDPYRRENALGIYSRPQSARYLNSVRSLAALTRSVCFDSDPGWNRSLFRDFADRCHEAGHPDDPGSFCGNQIVLENAGPDDVVGAQIQSPPFYQ